MVLALGNIEDILQWVLQCCIDTLGPGKPSGHYIRECLLNSLQANSPVFYERASEHVTRRNFEQFPIRSLVWCRHLGTSVVVDLVVAATNNKACQHPRGNKS